MAVIPKRPTTTHALELCHLTLAALGSIFENDESGAVLAEIAKLDPSFDKLEFSLRCERRIIPAVLEVRSTAVVDDCSCAWCATIA